jgi:hypothetical protein
MEPTRPNEQPGAKQTKVHRGGLVIVNHLAAKSKGNLLEFPSSTPRRACFHLISPNEPAISYKDQLNASVDDLFDGLQGLCEVCASYLHGASVEECDMFSYYLDTALANTVRIKALLAERDRSI